MKIYNNIKDNMKNKDFFKIFLIVRDILVANN